MDPVGVLRASPLFKGFTETGLGIIAGICSVRSYPQGAPLFVESMVSDSMLVVASGSVYLSTKNAANQDIFLGEIGPGDWLGELSLITPGQRQCTAGAMTAVTAVEIRHADFQKLLGLKPQACMKLLMGICTAFGQKVADNKDALKALVPGP